MICTLERRTYAHRKDILYNINLCEIKAIYGHENKQWVTYFFIKKYLIKIIWTESSLRQRNSAVLCFVESKGTLYGLIEFAGENFTAVFPRYRFGKCILRMWLTLLHGVGFLLRPVSSSQRKPEFDRNRWPESRTIIHRSNFARLAHRRFKPRTRSNGAKRIFAEN